LLNNFFLVDNIAHKNVEIDKRPMDYLYTSFLQEFEKLVLKETNSKEIGAGIATSYRLDDGSEFESWYGQEFSLLQIVHTGSYFHSTSYLLGTGDSFSGGKAGGA
jgi:hypothetical protein